MRKVGFLIAFLIILLSFFTLTSFVGSQESENQPSDQAATSPDNQAPADANQQPSDANQAPSETGTGGGLGSAGPSMQSAATQKIVVTVQIKGAAPHEYHIANGESFFVSTSSNPQDALPKAKPLDVLDQQRARLAKDVQAKVSESQDKQKQIDNEIYPAYRPPLVIEKQRLDQQLVELQAEQAKLDSEKTIRELQEKKKEYAISTIPASKVMGVNIKASLNGDKADVNVKAGDSENTISVLLGKWTQVVGMQPEVWVKVDQE